MHAYQRICIYIHLSNVAYFIRHLYGNNYVSVFNKRAIDARWHIIFPHFLVYL